MSKDNQKYKGIVIKLVTSFVLSISILVSSVFMLSEDVMADKYCSSYDKYPPKLRIGKSTYKNVSDGKKQKIVRIKQGKKKTILRSISGLHFVTNGIYLFYSNGHGKNYLGYKQNRIYRYNIKKKTNKYILKVNKNYCAIPIAKKGKYLIYEKGQEATTIYYSYNLKTHKKRKIGNFGYSSLKVKGKRVYITTTTLDVADPQYRFVYTLSGKKIGRITLKKGWY